MWQFPRGYKESFAVSMGLFVFGVMLELVSPVAIPALSFPYNVVAGVNLLVILILLFVFARKHPLVAWLGSTPAAVSSMAMFSVLSLLMGFIPQHDAAQSQLFDAGFSHVTSSWQYLFAQLYFVATLGMVTIRRATPFSFLNFGFLLNHAGLWLVIMGVALGAGDKQKVLVQLAENKPEWRGVNSKNEMVELPVAMTLRSFSIDDYNPSIVFINTATRDLLEEKKHGLRFLLEEGAEVEMHGYKVKVVDFMPDATRFDSTFAVFRSRGSVPAALVEVTSKDGDTSRGWISCGNYVSPVVLLRVNRSISLAMSRPHPKTYRSKLTINTPDGQTIDTSIVVNKPVTVNGWKIYQAGFDESKGKWSDVSIVEAVSDPWLPVIYTGFAMLIAGSGFILLKTRKRA